ncbi:hypothetical protein IFO69_15575 [Echinicola sp. CAU 1574]|uniref:Uncharacterized protein n=1 Tax=Echinicola arenosa TaxID=2774144 RepID=A0ABR9AQG1_9BACT|nr:hypothetical protein [Echinicola arenosa]MBD8490175.1 hypothetical protein [Echinicola arenosa]
MNSKLLLLVLFFIPLLGFSQVNPEIHYASPNRITGLAAPGEKVKISTDRDFSAEYTIDVSDSGRFSISFDPALNTGDDLIVWSENTDKEVSQRIFVKVEDASSILSSLTDQPPLINSFTSPSVAGKTVVYKATIWNTNFSIPLARFNFSRSEDRKSGDLLFFNSIGAGFGISGGELSETRDANGNLINQEFTNTLGLHLGFLFSAKTGEGSQNVFAPTLNVSVLDFQIGMGYELGTRSEFQRPGFLTISYAIPLYKLKKGGFWIWKSSRPINGPRDSRLGG